MQDESRWMHPWFPPLFALVFMPEHGTNLMIKQYNNKCLIIQTQYMLQLWKYVFYHLSFAKTASSAEKKSFKRAGKIMV